MTDEETSKDAALAELKAQHKAAVDAAFAAGQQSLQPQEDFSAQTWYPGRTREPALNVALKAEFERQGREGIPRRTTADSAAIKEIYRQHGR